jgi:hypothetical protein
MTSVLAQLAGLPRQVLKVAYVKILGQIEFIFIYRIFKAHINRMEYLGMFLIAASVVILLLWA